MGYAMDPLVLGTVSTIISLWLGSVEYRMKNLREALNQMPSKADVKEEIILRQEGMKVLQEEIKEDIREIKAWLAKLAEK